MRRMTLVAMVTAGAALCVSCGGGVSSYEEGIEMQADIMEEMLEVLEDVDDEASAEKAAGKIEALGTRLTEVAKQIQQLPEPSMDELQRIAKGQSDKRRDFQEKAGTQMMKLAQYQSLRDAWMRALSNM